MDISTNTTPEKFAEDLFHKMKGFKVTHKHSKKCAIVAVNILIHDHAELAQYTSDYTVLDFYQHVLTQLQNIKA